MEESFVDKEYHLLPYYTGNFKPAQTASNKPENWEDMVQAAELLSEGFAHVRVDLYNLNGKIYFGEMTFTHESGIIGFIPEEFDRQLGKQWIIQ